MIHHLKTKPEYFRAVIAGKKPFEIRKNDRDFKIGDKVILEEFLTTIHVEPCEYRNEVEYDQFYNSICRRPCDRGGKCGDYIRHIYTGQRCLIKIKDIFNLNNAGQDLVGYVAFTFDIIAINGKKI